MEESLARLRELSLALPREGCDWEERPHFAPPATPEQMAAFEQTVGFPLPEDVRTFLSQSGAVVAMSIHNGYWLGGIERFQIGGDHPRQVGGEPVAPIATDGGGNAFFVSAGGRVWCWDHETGKMTETATSFATFLERVAKDWEAYISDTPGWRFMV